MHNTNKSIHKIQSHNITLTLIQVQEVIQHGNNNNSTCPDKLNIPGTIIKLITNYIKGCKAYTTYRNHKSICKYKKDIP